MITTSQWIEMILVVPVPLITGGINAADFFIRTDARRGSLLYMSQHRLADFLAVHWLLVLALAFLVVGHFAPSVNHAFQICAAGWFVYINIRAMIMRRRLIANHTSEGIRQPADESPKPSM